MPRNQETADVMTERDMGFTETDRRMLFQLPVILKNLQERLEQLDMRLAATEAEKVDRAEVMSVENKILGQLNLVTSRLTDMERSKADRGELSKDAVVRHEDRLKVLELGLELMKAETRPFDEMRKEILSLHDWRVKSMALAAAIGSILMFLGNIATHIMFRGKL